MHSEVCETLFSLDHLILDISLMVKVINCRLTGLDPGSGYQSSAVCLLNSDLNQVPVSPRGAYSLHSMHYWCKATLHDPSLDQTLPSCCLIDSHTPIDHYSVLIFVTDSTDLDHIPLAVDQSPEIPQHYFKELTLYQSQVLPRLSV